MSYKIYFRNKDNSKFHKIDFLKKYGTLYDLLENLLTSKLNINNVNVYQIAFIIELMHGHNENDLFDEKIKISTKKVNLGKIKF